MEAARPTTLYLLCGQIAAGKSTLARRLAARPATLLISMDHWMSILFPTENRTIEVSRAYLRGYVPRWDRTLLTFYGRISRSSSIFQQTP
jgi:predicted kinase